MKTPRDGTTSPMKEQAAQSKPAISKREVKPFARKVEPKPVPKPEPKIPIKAYVRPGTTQSSSKLAVGAKVTPKVSYTASTKANSSFNTPASRT